MTPCRSLALDVGGVIYYDEPFELAWVQDVFDRARAEDSSFTLDRLGDDLKRHHLGGSGVFSTALAHESWLRVREHWTDLAQAMPGAVEAVRALAARHPLAVVANQPVECLDALEHLGLTKSFALIALDSEVGVAKPDPGLLSRTFGRLGWNASEVLVVGNRVDHDVVPARALGCSVGFVLPDHGWSTPATVERDVAEMYREVRPTVPHLTQLPGREEVDYLATGLAELAGALSAVA